VLIGLRARYHYWLGLALRSSGNRSGERAAYENAIGELTHALILDPFLARAYYVRGLIYWRELSDYARAVRDFTDTLNLEPGHAGAVLNRGLASVYGQLRTPAEQIADFERYLDIGKNGYWRIEAHNQIRRLQSIPS
jgi:tetratricopeptide (TPR) repeat protein